MNYEKILKGWKKDEIKVFQASTPYKNDNFNKYFYLKNKKYFEIVNCTLI